MPSKRMVPEQEIAELSDEMVRRDALHEAEIATLTAKLEASDDEHEISSEKIAALGARHDGALKHLDEVIGKLAALTEQRNEQMALADSVQEAMAKIHAPYWPLSIQEHVAKVTEQRDRAMKALRNLLAQYEHDYSGYSASEVPHLYKLAQEARAALDAEAAAETAPSLPETP